MAGALDEDTARTLASGRQTVGSMLSSAQAYLKRVFMVFVVGLFLTIWALRAFVWDRLKTDLVYNQMGVETADATEIIVTTPFDVILLQFKIGLIVGILVSVPVLIWYSRDSLKERGIWPDARIPLWKKVGFVLSIAFLFVGGISYAYFLFFPIMFNFLAENAVKAGFKPTWSIVMWTEFMFFLALSFGLAAQLPLAMTASARANVVSYETFRDKWRYAVVAIFVFGALFSPPDPFTMIMWGVPLVGLYTASLGITKFAVLSKQAGEAVPMRKVVTQYWNIVAGAAVLTGASVYGYFREGGTERTNEVLESIGSDVRVAVGDEVAAFGLDPIVIVGFVALLVALVVVAELLFYLRIRELGKYTREQARTRREAAAAGSGRTARPTTEDAAPGKRAEVDIGAMSAKAVRAAPVEAFGDLEEADGLGYAQQAIDNDNPEKAQAILDRLDEAEEYEPEDEEADDAAEEDEESIVTSTAAGMVDPFTEDETTEDDIGGYYYDIRFILDSLTSRAIWIVATFMVVMAGTFMILYTGGLRIATQFFFQNMPSEAVEEPEIVVLHPVEALIFMVKFSTLMGILAIVPVLLYFAWPSIEERFSTSGERGILAVWGITLLVAVGGGTALGFVYIAPTVFSLLALDVINANMIIAYRISSFGWLVIYLTVGVGLLAMIPATMLLFNHGNIVSYRWMLKGWRGVVLAFFAVAGLFTPAGVFTMFIVALPASGAYLLGLGLVRIYEWVFGESASDPGTDGEDGDGSAGQPSETTETTD